ncbi:MAG: hypothetical protein M3R62_00555 [Acidobacteriota bacterium]|nr:hypothetical protein [Acidobacteriota bacterium]
MTETIRRFLAQKLGGMGTCIAFVLLAVLSALLLQSGRPGMTILVVILLSAGIVSRDARSGALQMILSRPILRVEYLLGRYVGVLTGLAAFLLLSFGLAVGLDRVNALAGWGPSSFAWRDALETSAAAFPRGALDAAIILLFSTFLRGFGDVLAYVLSYVVLSVAPQIGMALGKPGIVRVFRGAMDNLAPAPDWGPVLRGGVLHPGFSRYALALTGYILLAALVFNRRELSYGTD